MRRYHDPQTAAGKVLLHFTMSLDGFVAGPEHSMDWMTGFSGRPGLEDEYVATTGAVLAEHAHRATRGRGRSLRLRRVPSVPTRLDTPKRVSAPG
jgi:hypothetical protein